MQNTKPALDIDALRQATPGCLEVIHLNNAGASLPAQSTLDRIKNYLDLEAMYGGYETAARHADQLENVYSQVARLIHADTDEIALMHSASDAWMAIFYSINFRPGDRILTGVSEYTSNFMAMLQIARRYDVSIEIVPDNQAGVIDTGVLADRMDDRVRLVALTHVPTNNGLVNPAQDVGEITGRWPAWYLLDACQSLGQISLDVNKIRCDFLTATGRKYLRGPRGTGLLYVRRKALESMEPDHISMRGASLVSQREYRLRDDARRFEQWEHSPALRLGLGNAAQQVNELGIMNINERTTALSRQLRAGIRDLPRYHLADRGEEQSAIVTFYCDSQPAESLVDKLHDNNINMSVSPAGMAGLDTEPRHPGAVIRASVHYYNTEEEIRTVVEALNTVAGS